MRLSTRSRYGVRMMLSIAQHQHQGPVRLKTIATEEDISEKYLVQILVHLKTANMVRTVRGPKGGCLLTRDTKDYTMYQILSCTEDSLSPADCVAQDEQCSSDASCKSHMAWKKLSSSIKDCLSDITLEDLLEGNVIC